jgi:polyketide biosynthesis enoyl-CoA hydratase PksH
MGLSSNYMKTMYQSILVSEQYGVVTLKINRPEASNSINNTLIKEMLDVFTQIESKSTIKAVVLEGNEQVFCTGMDFKAISSGGSEAMIADDPNGYYNLLKHITLCSKIVIAKVDGKVNAGGIGIVAASDIVIAGKRATFGLSEALFGLLPACVMPFLIRRIGIQKAQWMSLMTQGISVQKAYEIGLVDELSENTQEVLRRSLLRLTRLETTTILDLKDYMSKLWIMSEETQKLAVNKITLLLESNHVQQNIKNFVEKGEFPWNKK